MGKYFSIKSFCKLIYFSIAIIIVLFIAVQLYNGTNSVSLDFSSVGSQDFNLNDNDIDRMFSYDSDCAVNKSTSMVVMEASTKRVLKELNRDVRLEMASTTKVMTAIVAMENLPLDWEIAIADEAIGVEGSSIYLKKGEIWTVRDLLYGLMLRSGNDAAVALAVAAGGSVEHFVSLMNGKAEELGLENTHFQNPHGLHGDAHYTSAYDLAVISSYAMNNAQFKKIVGTKSYSVAANDTHEARYFANKNKMLALYDGGNGIKTGYTKDSGRCLVSSAQRDGMQLICVVLSCYDTYGVCSKNLDDSFRDFKPVSVGKSGDVLENFDIDGQKYQIALQNDLVLPLKEGEHLGISCHFVISDRLSAPLKSGSVVGKVEFYDGNRLLFDANIVNIEEINDIGVIRKISDYVGELHISYTNGEIKQIFSFDRSGVETRRG